MAAFNSPSALDLLFFHRQERELFNRLIHRLGQRQVPMQWVMSLWLWFESIGHHDFIRRVASSTDQVVLRFLAEAKACLRRLIFNSSSDQEEQQADIQPFPLTNTLMTESIALRFLDCNRHVALKGIVYFLKNVSEIIFDDNLMEIAARDDNQPATRQVLYSGIDLWRPSVRHSVWEPSNMVLGPAPAQTDQYDCSSSALLNPMARPWSPVADQSPEEQRSMFITFSRGYPLTRDEIKDFFNM